MILDWITLRKFNISSGVERKKAQASEFIPGQASISSLEELVLDPEVSLIIAEDNAMLNSGTFFLKKSQWSLDLMRRVYGDASTSPWVDHPWWENAALTWEFLKDVPHRFASDEYRKELEQWPGLSRGTGADGIGGGLGEKDEKDKKYFHELGEEERKFYVSQEMKDIYTPEVRIAPQHIFNSYHPVTSRFQHDTWEAGIYSWTNKLMY